MRYNGTWDHPTDGNVAHKTHTCKVYHQNAGAYVPEIFAHPYHKSAKHGQISQTAVCTDVSEIFQPHIKQTHTHKHGHKTIQWRDMVHCHDIPLELNSLIQTPVHALHVYGIGKY